MLRFPVIKAPIWRFNTERNRKFSVDAMRAGVYGLMLMDAMWLRHYPETPNLYDSGVIYKPEVGTEEWLTIPYLLAHGWGDCEDLASWRAAELRVRHGIEAKPEIKVRKLKSGQWRAHVVVELPDGTIEDPSVKLGMYAYRRG